MENLVKTTKLVFDVTHNGASAHVSVEKNAQGGINNLTIDQIRLTEGMFMGNLHFNNNASEGITKVKALLDEVLSEASNEE